MANDLTQWELCESPQQKLIREINEDIRFQEYTLEQKKKGTKTKPK